MPKVKNYTNQDFNSLKNEMLKLVTKYYPDKHSSFQDYSAEMMFLDLFSYVGDTLHFNIDDAFRNTFIQHAETLEDVLRICKSYGYNVRLSGIVYDVITISQLVPADNSGNPDLRYAYIINKGTSVRSGVNSMTYKLQENVYMKNYTDIKTEIFSENGDIEYFKIYAKGVVKGGNETTKSIRITDGSKDLKLFLDKNVAEILSVKDIEGNMWYEVDNMAQNTVREDISTENTKFSEYKEKTLYSLRNKKITKKFVGVVDHNNNFYLQFGQGTNKDSESNFVDYYDVIQKNNLNNLSLNENFIVNDLFYSKAYGEIPDNTILNIRYIKAIGETENALAMSVNSFLNMSNSVELSDEVTQDSIECYNEHNFTGGKLTKSVEELKLSLPVFISSQQRCVTSKDYMSAIQNMPAKYGNIEKVYTEESYNNLGVDVYVVSRTKNNKFEQTNIATKENIKRFIERYKSIGHIVTIRDAYIVNIACEVFYFGNNGFNNEEIELNIGKIIREYFDNSKMEIMKPIIIDDIKRVLLNYEGIRYISKINIKNRYDLEKDYSGIIYETNEDSSNFDNNKGIIMPPEEPSIFELKFPNEDIIIKHV